MKEAKWYDRCGGCVDTIQKRVDYQVDNINIWCDSCEMHIRGWAQYKTHAEKLSHCLKLCRALDVPCPKEAKKKEKMNADKVRFLAHAPLRQRMPENTQDAYHYFFPHGPDVTGLVAAVSPHPTPERMHIKIHYQEGVLGERCSVYYKHASDSDSEW